MCIRDRSHVAGTAAEVARPVDVDAHQSTVPAATLGVELAVLRLVELDAHILGSGRNHKRRALQLVVARRCNVGAEHRILSLIHISEPTRLLSISYAVFC